MLNKSYYEILKDPEKRKQYDINNGFNQVVLSTTFDEQVDILNIKKRDIYLKELLPPIKDWNLFKWMKNINKLKIKYNGIADSFNNPKKELNTSGTLVKILLQQFIPNNPTKNIKNATIVIEKDQDYSKVYNKLLTIPEVLSKLNAFVKYYGLDKKQWSSHDIKEINKPILQESPTKIITNNNHT